MVGGCISVFIRIALLLYLTILLIRIIDHQDNKNETVVQADKDVNIRFGDTNLKLVINIWNLTDNFAPIPYDD